MPLIRKKTVYIETSALSFYHNKRKASAYRRMVTRDWWRKERRHFQLYTSRFTVEEVSIPEYPAWRQVAAMASKLQLLEITPDIDGIVKAYIDHRLMPADDVGDAAHLAVASYHAVDYLLTWNCQHIANANKFDHIRTVNRRLGLVTPELVTPEQMFEEA